MNPYDKAHELAKSLMNDQLIIDFKELKKKIELDKELNDKIENFKKIRLELQLKSIEEGNINKDSEEKVKKEYQELLANPFAVEYFEKEVQINILLSDIQRIVYEDFQNLL